MRKYLFFLLAAGLLVAACNSGIVAPEGAAMDDGMAQGPAASVLDSVVGLCLADSSDDPIVVMERLMSSPACHMHGPEHHVLVGAALLTAYHNAGGDVDLPAALEVMLDRGQEVPGGACGAWGACGAALSTGMFLSIITDNGPLEKEAWRLSNLMTAQALEQVALHGGPRCCKRDSYLSILAAVDFVEAHLGVRMGRSVVVCSRSQVNSQCIGSECPFSPGRPRPRG